MPFRKQGRPKKALTKLLLGLLIGLLVFVAAVGISLVHPKLVEELEYRTWDWRHRLSANRTEADPRIKLIVVDQASLDFLEREYALTWPIPRDAYKHIISFLTASGARGLAFDLLFTESSAQAVESDRELAEASGGKLPVVHAVNLESYQKFINPEKLAQFERREQELGPPERWLREYLPGKVLQEYPSITLPIPEIIDHSRALGSVHAEPDTDGVYRRYQIAGAYNARAVLGLPTALFDVTGQKPGPRLGSLLDDRGRAVIHLHGAGGAYQTFSFADVLQSEAARADGLPPAISLDAFRDSWVFLGTTAPGLLDLRPTSLHERGNGIEFVAAAFDNLLHDNFIAFPPLAVRLILSLALISGTLAVTLFGENFRYQGIWLALFVGTFLGGTIVFARNGIWVPLVVPTGSSIAAAFLGISLRYRLEGRQLRFIRRAFQFYLSPSVVDRIVENPDTLALGGEKRELSMLFSDIVNFTQLSEKIDPALLVALLNEYLSLMSDTIQARGGTVDKYVGDAVVAFWNAPLEVPDHAYAALDTAITCQKLLLEHGAYFREQFGAELITRMGVHTATVTVGNFGSRTRFDYTMIGDGANLSSRLEGINKYFGTLVLFSEAVHERVKGRIISREVADIQVLGRAEPVRVYEPSFDSKQQVFQGDNLERYRAALNSYKEGDWETARKLFGMLIDDPVSRAYLERMKKLETEKTFLNSWTPIWEFTEK